MENEMEKANFQGVHSFVVAVVVVVVVFVLLLILSLLSLGGARKQSYIHALPSL